MLSNAGALVRTLQAIGAHRVALEVPDNLAMGRLTRRDCRPSPAACGGDGAEAIVLSACVRMPSLAAGRRVEDELGVPVITAATATTFEVLRALGHQPSIQGAGRQARLVAR